MKKILFKALSVVLAVAMLLPLNLAFSFAETEDEAPVFTVSKVSETETELVLMLSLKSGRFECFDAAVTVEGLTCKYIITTDDFDTFVKAAKLNGEQCADSENPENGKISLSITSGVIAPMDIAIYAFTKEDADGINGSDVNFEMISCYIDKEGEENPVDVSGKTGTEITLPAKHVHVSDNTWVETEKATCTEDGEKVTHCTECGQIASTETIKATGHGETYEKNRVEPTCTEDGSVEIYCKVCEQLVEKKTLDKKGHGETYEKNRVDATCLKDGSVDIYCSVCKEFIETKTLTAKGSHGETYEKNRVEPTCTEDGSVEIYCKDCDELIENKKLDKTGHGETYEMNRVEPTCLEDGSVDIYCSVCKKLIETKTLKAKGSHGEAKEIRKEATCTEDGYIKTVCPDCGEELADAVILKKTGHHIITDKKAATCTEDGYIRHCCDNENCDYVQDITVLKSEGHKYVTDEKKATCHEAGYKSVICSVCHDVKSYEELPQLTHEWTSWSTIKEPTYRTYGISRRSCRLCGEFEEKDIPMVEVKATDITISMESFSMNYKQSSRLYADVVPEEAAFSTDITWESSNPKVCTVDENGTVYAAGKGTATITASTPDGELTSECTVTVTYSWLQWIIVYILFGWIWY